MRVLFDIVHPAHVHFYRHMISRLVADGGEYRIVAREKDVTIALLDRLGLPYQVEGRVGRRSYLGQAAELARRDLRLWRVAREFRPDVIATRNPAGVQAARLAGVVGVFDTDNGTSAGVHFRAAAPFAHVITTPACHGEDFGRKHRRYPGYKPLAFLHPNHFTPDPTVRRELGVEVDERYFIVRLVAMQASHDHAEEGMSRRLAGEIIRVLEGRGRVFVSTEAELPEEFEPYRFPAGPDRMLDAMAFTSLLVGDSGSMAAECAVLGSPNIFYGSFARRLDYLNDLEDRFGLCRNVRLGDEARVVECVSELTAESTSRADWAERRALMLGEAVDVAEWYYELLREMVG